MSAEAIKARLFEEISKFTVIDCHEHLGPEIWRTERPVDATILFSHYCRTDLITAGMPAGDYDRMLDWHLPLWYRWGLLSPYLQHIKHGSYARAGLIAARELYGFEDVNDSNFEEVSAKLQEGNRPGLYQRILREKCGIRVALTQCRSTKLDSDLLVPLMPLTDLTDIADVESFRRLGSEVGMVVNTLDDLVEAADRKIAQWKAEGAVGLKMISQDFGTPSREAAYSVFRSLMDGTARDVGQGAPLRTYLLDMCLRHAAKHQMVVAVHTGMWGDFRTLDPTHMIPVFPRHPETRFDVYHAGMPWVRETGVIGKNNPNVWLNLCWCHVISQRMTVSFLDEWIDLVPVNKIFAFGGDYGMPVEKVVGHLWMAREDIAEVLASRVARGDMTEDRALEIANMWFYDNAVQCYPLLEERLAASPSAVGKPEGG